MLNEISVRYKTFVTIIFTSIVLLIGLYFSYLSVKNHLTNYLEIYLKKSYYNFIFPTQYSLSRATDWTSDFVKSVTHYERTSKEISTLKAELLQYQNTIALNTLLQKENEELKKIIKYNQNSSYITVLAKVIAKDPQNFFNTLIIDKGKLDNLKEDFVVVSIYKNQYAIVGFIESVNNKSSIIRTIGDQQCRVSVYIEGYSTLGIMKGQIPISFNPIVEFIDKNLKNLINQQVITSGVNPKYPKNILIGSIVQVENRQDSLFQSVIVKPYINFFTLEHVLIFIQENK